MDIRTIFVCKPTEEGTSLTLFKEGEMDAIGTIYYASIEAVEEALQRAGLPSDIASASASPKVYSIRRAQIDLLYPL